MLVDKHDGGLKETVGWNWYGSGTGTEGAVSQSQCCGAYQHMSLPDQTAVCKDYLSVHNNLRAVCGVPVKLW